MNIYIIQKLQFDENMTILTSQVLGAYKDVDSTKQAMKEYIKQECNEDDEEDCLSQLELYNSFIYDVNAGHGHVEYKYYSINLH